MKKKIDEKREKNNKIFEKFKAKVMSEFSVNDVAVYVFSEDDLNGSILIGKEIDTISLEKYISYSNTVLLCAPAGLQNDDNIYKSRLITQIKICDAVYLIVMSSCQMEAFKGSTAKNIIDDIIKLVKEGNIL